MANKRGLKLETDFKMKPRRFAERTRFADQRERFREDYHEQQVDRFGEPRSNFGRRKKPPSRLKRIWHWRR